MIDAELSKSSFCARCDYQLHGLPEVGLCPECGEAYDRNFIILRGQSIFAVEAMPDLSKVSGMTVAMVVVAICFAVCVAIISVIHGLPRVFTALFAFPVVIALLPPLLVSLAATRKETVVWMSSAGIGKQPRVDADGLAGKVIKQLQTIQSNFTYPYVVMIVVIIVGRGRVISAIILFLFLVAICFLLHVAGMRSRGLPAAGIRPALRPWPVFGSVEICELGEDAVQLWAKKSPHVRQSDVVRIRFKASHASVVELFALLEQWASPEIPLLMKADPIAQSGS